MLEPIKKFLKNKGDILQTIISVGIIVMGLQAIIHGRFSNGIYFNIVFSIFMILQGVLSFFDYTDRRKEILEQKERSVKKFKETIWKMNGFMDDLASDKEEIRGNKEIQSSIKLIKMELDILQEKLKKF